MNEEGYDTESAEALCQSCGLCCSGHLFTWTMLRAVEMSSVKTLGLTVIHPRPNQRGFAQPCSLWNGTCTVYHSPYYPRSCRSYKCKLLREFFNEEWILKDALKEIKNARREIAVVEKLLPVSNKIGFRARVEEYLESADKKDPQLELKVKELLKMIEEKFGVNDFID